MMSLRKVVGLAPSAVAAVDEALSSIKREHKVRIPLAIESGSRAWGFPSPDSDYDCRFIFVRPTDQLVTLWPARDVIELPIEGDLDVSGWELGKALRLLLKGNAVVIEWLMSPIIYGAVIEFRDELIAFAESFADPVRIQSHYLHLGARQRVTYLAGNEPVPLTHEPAPPRRQMHCSRRSHGASIELGTSRGRGAAASRNRHPLVVAFE
jgi:predicted nucleotidyltransferase